MKLIFILIPILIISACTSSDVANKGDLQNNTLVSKEVTQSSPSFAYPMLKWNNQLYRITSTEEVNLDEEIGEITKQNTTETEETPDNSSSYLRKGTKIWSITGIDTKDAIAVKVGTGKFIKAVFPPK